MRYVTINLGYYQLGPVYYYYKSSILVPLYHGGIKGLLVHVRASISISKSSIACLVYYVYKSSILRIKD